MSASNERVGIRGRVTSSCGGLPRQQPPNLNFQAASGPNPPTSLKLSSHRTPEPSSFSRLLATLSPALSVRRDSLPDSGASGELWRGQQSAALTTSPPNNCPPSLGPSRRRRPCPAWCPEGHGAAGEAEGREGRALPAEQSPRHALFTPRADKRSLWGCRSHAPPARARWAKCGHRGERPG